MDKIQRIKELVELLNRASDAYYNTGDTIMEDQKFDTLVDELRALEQETGFIMATSPTQKVGYEVKSELQKVKHNHPMLSLDKTKSLDDVLKFLGDKTFVAMPKMDGLTCSLCYLDGQLVSAETRGNGEIGESVLHCAKVVKNIPMQISYKDELIVDGEMIIADDDFKAINSILPDGEKYKNSRNLVSGSIRQLDSSIAAQRNMRFIAWKCVTPIHTGDAYENNNSFDWRLDQLEELGFEVVYHFYENISRLRARTQYRSKKPTALLENIITLIEHWADEKGYPLDGCVFGYDDIAYGESLGATNHHLRSQYAFKFKDEVYETSLLDVEWGPTRSGLISPVAVFEPVDLDGAITTRATLHNLSIIKQLELGIGDKITVYRSNMVIPKIDNNLTRSNTLVIPDKCPCCGANTVIKDTDNSQVLMCPNPDCTAKKIAQFTHFVSRKCMNIDGMSEKSLETLISIGVVKKFVDIYHLSDHRNKLILLDGWGPKSVDKLLQSIEKSRSVKLENFIAALGIPNIGISAAKTISNYFHGNYVEFINAYFYWHIGWTRLEDFGEVMAESLNNYLHDNLEDIEALAREMNFIVLEKKSITSNLFIGKVLCVTGKLNYFTRDGINEKIVSLGAKTVNSVSKKTDYLITNEASESSKYKKAIELNVPIITEDEFLKMCGEQFG